MRLRVAMITAVCSLLFVWIGVSSAQTSGPSVLEEGVVARKVLDTGGGYIRLVRNPATGDLYVLRSDQGVFRLTLGDEPDLALVASNRQIGGQATGMAFRADGTMYLVLNERLEGNLTQAGVRRGVANDRGGFEWGTVAATEPYPLSQTFFDHQYNGIVVSPDGRWLFVNAGSRTDHGEVQGVDGVFPDAREVPLTAMIVRLPAHGIDLVLPSDGAALERLGYVYARGTRNAYDLAFAPNGDLFAVDNGPDADYPDELNWVREGLHYGFPWRFGNQDNPQQFPGYDGEGDRRLQSDFEAVRRGFYRNDPGFPPPAGPFADPVANLGPDAALYRADDGSERDAAAAGEPLYTFTPHRSPLGLVFVTDSAMPIAFQADGERLSAFVVSWGAAGGTLSDRGADLLHLVLQRGVDNYEMTATQVATGFANPIDAVLIENRLYVLEWGPPGGIWELTFGLTN